MALEKRTNAPDTKPNKWRVRITRNGRRYEEHFYGNKKEAKQFEHDFINRINKGLIGSNENMLFDELFNLVKNEYILRDCKNNTLRSYTNLYKNHISKAFGSTPLNKIKSIDIQMFANKLSDNYKPYTVKRALSVIHVCLNKAEEWGIISNNPYKFIKPPKEEIKTYNEIMSMQDIKCMIEIYSNAPRSMHKTAFFIAIGCGLRNSEIRALTLDDIDLVNKTLNVDKQVGLYDDDKGKSISTKTIGSTRKIYVPDFVCKVLKDYLDHLQPFPINKQLFWSPATNKPINSHTLSSNFSSTLSKHNLPPVRFHDLRHIHATLLINDGINVKSVSNRLGHSKVETTLRFYTNTIEEYDKQAATQFDSTFIKIKNG